MHLENRLQASIDRWNLLESKFYQAWNDGSLPVEALKTYAREYGDFISRIPNGWVRHGDSATAVEERTHVEMWQRFAGALGTSIGQAQSESMKALVETTDRCFSDEATSLGALYAFEAQQPETSKTKLEGLRKHYDVPESGEAYFAVHADDYGEPKMLLDRMQALEPEQQAAAAQACEETCRALRSALDRLYEECASNAPAA